MKKIQLNSSLCPLVYVNMYDSLLSPQNWEETVEDNDFTRNIVDQMAFDRCVVDFCQTFIDDNILPILTDYGVKKITALSIYHPREYNLATDALIFNVEMQAGWKKMMRDNLQRFADNCNVTGYIRDHYFSRKGFFSYMPQSCKEIEQFQDPDRCLAAYLTLSLIDHDALFFKGDGWDFGILERCQKECVDYLNTNFMEFVNPICFLDNYVDRQTAEQLASLYQNPHGQLDLAVSQAMTEYGHAWRWAKYSYIDCDTETGTETLFADNDAMQCIIWALKEKHTDLLLQTA